MGIYGILGPSWVLITIYMAMAPRNNGKQTTKQNQKKTKHYKTKRNETKRNETKK